MELQQLTETQNKRKRIYKEEAFTLQKKELSGEIPTGPPG